MKLLLTAIVLLLLAIVCDAAPTPTHLMKHPVVRIGDQFRFKHESHYVYKIEGNMVWTHIGGTNGGVGHDHGPFTTEEVEALCNNQDLPTSRIWYLLSNRKVNIER